MVNVSSKIKILFPSAVFFRDYVVSDNAKGEGEEITFWNDKTLGAYPGDDTLENKTQQVVLEVATEKVQIDSVIDRLRNSPQTATLDDVVKVLNLFVISN